MKEKKRWEDLTGAQKVGIIVMTMVQLGLLAGALWDIRKRPADEINGNKWVWVGVSLINYVGPLAYFKYGRKQ
ncbi:MAG: PLDc N-terminal domain-containing protein [Chloroflexaceae bacterium]